MKTNKSIQSIVVLVAICAVVGAILGVANYFTAEKIADNERLARENARTEVLPEGHYTFSERTVPGGSSVTGAWLATDESGAEFYVFQMETRGYASGLVLTCGMTQEGVLVRTTTVVSNETPSLGGKTERDSYRSQYEGKTAGELAGIDGISGATKTSNAYRGAIEDAFAAFRTLTEGEEK